MEHRGRTRATRCTRSELLAKVEVVALLTTSTVEYGRVSMHGVREVLLDRQADALGLPGVKIGIPSPCPNDVYEREMARALEAACADGVSHVVFGDLFLEDLRVYREAPRSTCSGSWGLAMRYASSIRSSMRPWMPRA